MSRLYCVNILLCYERCLRHSHTMYCIIVGVCYGASVTWLSFADGTHHGLYACTFQLQLNTAQEVHGESNWQEDNLRA